MNLQSFQRSLSIGVFSFVAIMFVLPYVMVVHEKRSWENELNGYYDYRKNVDPVLIEREREKTERLRREQ